MTKPNAEISRMVQAMCPGMEIEMAREITDLAIHAQEEAMHTIVRITKGGRDISVVTLAMIVAMQLTKACIEIDLEETKNKLEKVL